MLHGLESFENLVEALQSLPTIGKKSARNLAFHMVGRDHYGALKLAHAIEKAVGAVKFCTRCGNLSEHELCDICSDDERDLETLCLVSNAKDIMTLEESGGFTGRYFVFGSMEEADLEKLYDQVRHGVREVIFAFPPSIQNDALIYYIEEKLSPFGLVFTKIAQGVPTGVNLENVDTVSLARALESRVKV